MSDELIVGRIALAISDLPSIKSLEDHPRWLKKAELAKEVMMSDRGNLLEENRKLRERVFDKLVEYWVFDAKSLPVAIIRSMAAASFLVVGGTIAVLALFSILYYGGWVVIWGSRLL